MNTRQAIQTGLKDLKKKRTRVDGVFVPSDGQAANFQPLSLYNSCNSNEI